MKAKGQLVHWDDDKGYGFIAPQSGGDQVFVHVKAFRYRHRRPAVGDFVTYLMVFDNRGRLRAEEVTLPGAGNRKMAKKPTNPLPYLVAIGFLAALGGAAWMEAMPKWVVGLYLVASVVTFMFYDIDKRAAQNDDWRTSETTLHLLAFFGGWPGALVAQNFLRHKTKKQSFRSTFWTIVMLNCVVLGWWFTPMGQEMWRSLLDGLPRS